MKKFFLPIFFLFLLLAACKKETSGKEDYNVNSGEVTVVSTDVEAGEVVNGEYVATNPAAVLLKWKERISGLENLSEPVIIKGINQETQEEYYLLHSKSENGYIKAACLLIRKGDKFYFDIEGDGYQFVVCKSTCAEGCDVGLLKLDEENILTCSECPDCVKSGTHIR